METAHRVQTPLTDTVCEEEWKELDIIAKLETVPDSLR
jgi:hypothetical protein